MIIKNLTKNTVLVHQTKIADTFFLRLKGLLGSPPLERGQGLLLKGKSIHTLFMGFAIDVIYIDHDWKVIKTDQNMVPFRLGKFIARSENILELPVGVIEETQTSINDQLTILE